MYALFYSIKSVRKYSYAPDWIKCCLFLEKEGHLQTTSLNTRIFLKRKQNGQIDDEGESHRLPPQEQQLHTFGKNSKVDGQKEITESCQ